MTVDRKATLTESLRVRRDQARDLGVQISAVSIEELDVLLTWLDATPAAGPPAVPAPCPCACHQDPTPVGLVHVRPCCGLVTEVQILEEQEELRSRQVREWMLLPSYGTTRGCVKCGGSDARTFFCSMVTRMTPTMFGAKPFLCDLTVPAQRDHLHRICEQCGYAWTERPLDDGQEAGA